MQICAKCQASQLDSAKYCSECGPQIEQVSMASRISQEEGKFNLKKSMTLFLCASVILSIAPCQAQAAPSSSVRLAIRALYYGITQAYSRSTKEGIAYQEARIYPQGINKTSPKWLEAKRQMIAEHYTELPIPNLSSIDNDPSWVRSAGKCHQGFAKPVKGDTYIVSVDFGNGHPRDVHVTLLNGKAYIYLDFCEVDGVHV